jgi:hypothetical protein
MIKVSFVPREKDQQAQEIEENSKGKRTGDWETEQKKKRFEQKKKNTDATEYRKSTNDTVLQLALR